MSTPNDADRSPAAKGTRASRKDDAPIRAPQQIGRYQVVRLLGEGGFGRVYLAQDPQLDRQVAIKVPHRKLVARPEDAESYLAEARIAAKLDDHPNIVRVLDVGSSDEFPCFIVSKFIAGKTLGKRMAERPLDVAESADLVATIARALHYAHSKGVFHRDIKPGNILLDAAGNPYLADFGLALREENVGGGLNYCGTVPYMSPEQARGEGNRVDGRSDIFSLGAVLYELMTGRRPFRADTQAELLAQIVNLDPRPPRQINDTIPKELERVCLKALSKRASDRYTTALDLAEDLNYFFQQATLRGPMAVSLPGKALSDNRVTPSDRLLIWDQPIQIELKGLRSFDETDAGFFLELLPGPRDRHGVPDSIRFWERGIAERNPERTFAVGLIYGPSGCGKSSFVRAGLLPRLAEDKSIERIYIEATAEETESRLLNRLRKQFPGSSETVGLKDTLAAMRRGMCLAPGSKFLIIVDQFEQWLHAKQGQRNTELVQALRQCDGERGQVIVMVRDDFWLATTRFFAELEIDLVQGQNIAVVDLFDRDHAKRVLVAMGRKLGKLPESPKEMSREQKQFLEQAVSGLTEDGKVICVRLTLFAEMMKARQWLPATLRDVGGMERVAVNFLEQTFASPTANPKHRLHRNATQAVLMALLPEPGADIKGRMRSQQELRDLSGYSEHPKDFADLIHILDQETRLITPADPQGSALAGVTPVAFEPGCRYYQLTHDYLVSSVREWLTRKQKETLRGRAELHLADCAALWCAHPENRHLPTLWGWLWIRLLAPRKNWTPQQHKMMLKAARYHRTLALIATAILLLVGLGLREAFGRFRAHYLRDRLLEATTTDVAGIISEMEPYRRWLNGLLQESYAQAEREKDARKQLRASLALVRADVRQVEYLCERLLSADPEEVLAIRDSLQPHAVEVSQRLWDIVEDRAQLPRQRLRAACALSAYAAADSRWQSISHDVVAQLVAEHVFVIAQWAEALRPVRRHLLSPLAALLVEDNRDAGSRRTIIRLYGNYAEGLDNPFEPLEKEASPESPPAADRDQRLAQKRRQAKAVSALAALGRWQPARLLLQAERDPTVRSYLIEYLASGGADAGTLAKLLSGSEDASVRRAALLTLSEFNKDELPEPEREQLTPVLSNLYRDARDGGTRAAAGWLLRRWQKADRLAEIDGALATGKPEGARGWYVSRKGRMMILVPPGPFQRGTGTKPYEGRVDHAFALAAFEVTLADFLRFRKDHKATRSFAVTEDCPVNQVSWYDAAAYCNWLSEQEGIPRDQWCYCPNADGQYADGIRTAAQALARTGYRLPTTAEWEAACRAGSVTRWSMGEAEELLAKYAWYVGNAASRLHPVGRLRPNDLGFFDMHGNAWEWCHDSLPNDAPAATALTITDADGRVARGGAFGHGPLTAQCISEIVVRPTQKSGDLGFRPARTMPADSARASAERFHN
jgi:serine/threonine protein kinase/formylglycine-generating enzyme required for sulfatase activity